MNRLQRPARQEPTAGWMVTEWRTTDVLAHANLTHHEAHATADEIIAEGHPDLMEVAVSVTTWKRKAKR